MIIILDIISSLFLLAIIILLFLRLLKHKQQSKFILWAAFVFLFISTIFNIPEHILNVSTYDVIEAMFDILFLPTLILAIHITIIEKALLKSKINEQKFKVIFNQAYSLIGLLDCKGKLIEANEQALKMIDATGADVLNMPFHETPWWTHSETEQQKLKDAISKAKKGHIIHFETNHIDVSGTKKTIDFSITPVIVDTDIVANFIVEGRDITEIKTIQEELEFHKNNLIQLVNEKTEKLETSNSELQATNDELYEKNEIINEQNAELNSILQNLKEMQAQLVLAEKMASVGTLTAGLAHEINNPLNFINGTHLALKMYFDEYGSHDEKKTTKFLNAMQEGIQRISNILHGLNQFSKQENPGQGICDIHAILENCLLVLNNKIGDSVEIIKKYASSKIEVKGSVSGIHQVFLSILLNAFQSLEGNGSVEIETTQIGRNCKVVITDNGCGIDKINLSKITEPFFTTKAPGEGTGLGLSIAYTIIKEHKGTLDFQSELNKGTKVAITLPSITIEKSS